MPSASSWETIRLLPVQLGAEKGPGDVPDGASPLISASSSLARVSLYMILNFPRCPW